jgi:GH15 family glucan-1,4-alpha-glucosidase
VVDHQPPGIGEHGIIGDLRSAALITTGGRVSWFCAGRFDSPSVFDTLLDEDSGGRWDLRPVGAVSREQQFYFPDTNVLVTRFLTTDGIVELQDFMVLLGAGDPAHRQRLVRRVVAVRGKVRMRTAVSPRPDYGRATPQVEAVSGGVRFTGTDVDLTLRTTVALEAVGADATAEFDVSDGETASFVLEVGGEPGALDDGEVADLFDTTVGFWRTWLAGSAYRGRWREQVHRSALALKLLTHEPTGAVIAAPTMGLPEQIGGERNWDYRYVWIRDAAFTVYALLRLGFTAEADAFIGWLSRCIAACCVDHDREDGPLRVMYSIDGTVEGRETELEHLPGFRGSRPVLLGNGAAAQLQLDIYGELIDSIYLYDKHTAGISHDTWTDVCSLLDWLLDNWDRPDDGIWEARGKPADHTFSRVMCWVAVERMIRIARRRGLPGDLPRWSRVRDEIYRQVFERGWDDERGAFVQSYDDDALDASLLLMPMVKFCSPTEPRFLSTLDQVEHALVVDSLVFRYDPRSTDDGLDGREATFTLCSFWYIEALIRAGRTEQARVLLDKTFTYGNHVGLFAEQIALTGEQLGNFPQAFTHLSLISATINLDRALG